jgi:hypothetical protein
MLSYLLLVFAQQVSIKGKHNENKFDTGDLQLW